jgi:hypothetical protein
MGSFKLYLPEQTYLIAIDDDGSFLTSSESIVQYLDLLFSDFIAGKYFYSIEEAIVAFVNTLEHRWVDKVTVPKAQRVQGRIY